MSKKPSVECTAMLQKGTKCEKSAKYFANKTNLCGTHAKKYPDRKPLDDGAGPAQEKPGTRPSEQVDEVMKQRERNEKAKKRGDVLTTNTAETPKGYQRIYIHPKYSTRKDGIILESMHELNLRNIEHGQPGLPVAKNFYNFHSANICTNPDKVFFEAREKLYHDEEPKRSKRKGVMYIWQTYPVPGSKNVEYKIGETIHAHAILELDLEEARNIYCKLVTESIIKTCHYEDLIARLNFGYNICIFMDHPIDLTIANIQKIYKDMNFELTSEHVVAILAYWHVKELPSEQLPWNKSGKILPSTKSIKPCHMI